MVPLLRFEDYSSILRGNLVLRLLLRVPPGSCVHEQRDVGVIHRLAVGAVGAASAERAQPEPESRLRPSAHSPSPVAHCGAQSISPLFKLGPSTLNSKP